MCCISFFHPNNIKLPWEKLKGKCMKWSKSYNYLWMGGGSLEIVTFIDKEGEIYLLYLDKQMTLKKK